MMHFVLTLLLAWLLADFIAGLWHWIEDRYFDERWPIIGEYIAKPNTLHHAQPAAFLQGDYWTRNWTTIVPAAVAFGIACLCNAPLWLLLTFAFVSQANEVHAWAHRRVSSRLIRGLQEFGLLQSPRHHAVHHKAPFDCRYCVMSDWLNPILDSVRFWTVLEWLLWVFGLKVKPDLSKPAPQLAAVGVLLLGGVFCGSAQAQTNANLFEPEEAERRSPIARDASLIEPLAKRLDDLARQVAKQEPARNEIARLERQIYVMEARIEILERRWRIYEPDKRYPWERNYRRDIDRLPPLRAMDELADAFADALDDEDDDDDDDDRHDRKRRKKDRD